MFIIPYSFDSCVNSSTGCKVWKVSVFLTKGGTEIWETDHDMSDQEIIDTYLTPNGFVGEGISKNGTFYFKLKKELTNFSDLYTWTEFLEKEQDIPDVPILRPFLWIGDEIGVKDDWGWADQCKEIQLGRYGTLLTLWSELSSLLPLGII